MMTFQEFTAFVESLTPAIRQIVDRHINTVAVDYKADDSPVTLADKEIEAYLADQIMTRFPDSRIVGEESGNHGTGATEWVVDPIDGTKSFMHGVPLFATLIGVVADGKPVYGAIYNPLMDDLVVGDNHTALWNGRPTRVRPCEDFSRALLLTTDLANISKYRTPEGFNRLAQRCWLMRTWGDAYGYFLLATGRGDIMVDPKMNRWDLTALIPVIRGAGGIITDYYGGDPAAGDSIVAAAPELHAEVIRLLNE